MFYAKNIVIDVIQNSFRFTKLTICVVSYNFTPFVAASLLPRAVVCAASMLSEGELSCLSRTPVGY